MFVSRLLLLPVWSVASIVQAAFRTQHVCIRQVVASTLAYRAEASCCVHHLPANLSTPSQLQQILMSPVHGRKHLQEYANQVFIFSKAFPNMLWRQQSMEKGSDELRILENGNAPVIPQEPWWPADSAPSHRHGKACSSLLWVHAVARSLRAHVGTEDRPRL